MKPEKNREKQYRIICCRKTTYDYLDKIVYANSEAEALEKFLNGDGLICETRIRENSHVSYDVKEVPE